MYRRAVPWHRAAGRRVSASCLKKKVLTTSAQTGNGYHDLWLCKTPPKGHSAFENKHFRFGYAAPVAKHHHVDMELLTNSAHGKQRQSGPRIARNQAEYRGRIRSADRTSISEQGQHEESSLTAVTRFSCGSTQKIANVGLLPTTHIIGMALQLT